MSDTSFSSTITTEPPQTPMAAPQQSPQANLPSVHGGSSGSTASAPAKVPAKTVSRPRSVGIANIVAAIAAVTSEIGVVKKEGFNAFHKYKYVAMEDVLQRLTPLLAKHGLVIFQNEVERVFVDDGRAVAVAYEFTVAHISGETWSAQRKTGLCRAKDSKGGFDDKSFNKASTAARKYFLLELFQIPTDDMPDADAQSNVGDTPPRASTRARPAATPGADTDSRLDTGERYDARTGEIISDTPATDPHVGDVKGNAGAAAQPPAGSNGGIPQQEAFEAADYQLGEAAKRGMATLETAWYALPEALRKVCKIALDTRHKATALAADQAERMKTGDFTNAA